MVSFLPYMLLHFAILLHLWQLPIRASKIKGIAENIFKQIDSKTERNMDKNTLKFSGSWAHMLEFILDKVY